MIVAAVLGLGLWIGLVVVPDDTGGSAFLWASLLAAVALGLRTWTDSEAWMIGIGLAGAPLLLAPWTAPRGDNDGLWLLVFPLLLGLVFLLTFTAWVSGSSTRRFRRRSSPDRSRI